MANNASGLKRGFLACHKLLVQQIEPMGLMIDLIPKGIISTQEKDIIAQEAVPGFMTDKLLMYLHRKAVFNPDVYSEFLAVMEEEETLKNVVESVRAAAIQQGEGADYTYKPGVLDEAYSAALKEHEHTIVASLSAGDILPDLVSAGAVSPDENELIRNGVSSNGEQAKRLLKIVRQRGSAGFLKFKDALLDSESQQQLGKLLLRSEVLGGGAQIETDTINQSASISMNQPECSSKTDECSNNIGFSDVSVNQGTHMIPHLPDEPAKRKQLIRECEESKDKLTEVLTNLNFAFIEWMKIVSLDNHKEALCTIPGTKPLKKKSPTAIPLFEDRRQEIMMASNYIELWNIVSDYVCWTNRKLLAVVVNVVSRDTKTTTSTCKVEFDAAYAAYEDALKQYYKKSPRYFPKCSSTNPAPGSEIKVKVQMPFDTITLGEIERFEGEMARELNLETYSLKLCQCTEGCTQLLYSIPQCLHHSLLPLNDEKLKQLSLLQIIELEMIGYHFILDKDTRILKLSCGTKMREEIDVNSKGELAVHKTAIRWNVKTESVTMASQGIQNGRRSTQPPRPDQKPTLAELQSITVNGEAVSIITETADNWRNICMAFNFDANGRKLKVIEQRYPNQAEDCSREMFQTWLKKKEASWRSLIAILEACDEAALAEQVKIYVGIGSQQEATEPPKTPSPPGETCTEAFDGNEEEPHQTTPPADQPTTDERFPIFQKWDDTCRPKHVSRMDKEWEAVKKYSEEVKILIQSCNTNEYNASLELLEPDTTLQTVIKFSAGKDQLPIVLGTIAHRKCALVYTRQGKECQEDVTTALHSLPNAEAIIGIGIAFAISKDKFKYGDVLIGKQIVDYENAKIEEDKITPRGEVRDTDRKLCNTFCSTNIIGWNFYDLRAEAGSIASKAELVNDRSLIEKLKKNNHIGGEMEGWALKDICTKLSKDEKREVHFIIIKGVSDFGDGHKDDRWQITAAKAAANFFQYCLQNSDAFL